MKKVAVVILNWNGQKLLQKFLPSIIEYTDKDLADIFVVDNNSSDGSCSFLEKIYPQINIIKLSENLGYAEGYNVALRRLEHEYFILLNSDVEVTENWLEPLIDYLDKSTNTAGVQPKILSEKNKDLFEYAGASGGFIDKWGYPFCRGRIFDKTEQDSKQYNTSIDIFWASGACLAIRSADYWIIGGLDKTFFAHMEEIDLCWRLNARNRKLACIPQSVVYHVGGATLDEQSPRKTFLNFRNNLLMIYKNTSDKEFKSIFRYRIVLDYIAALQMLASGKSGNAKAVIKAHKEFKKIKENYFEIKKENLDKRTVDTITTIYPKSILKSYYLDRKSKFSDLNWD